MLLAVALEPVLLAVLFVWTSAAAVLASYVAHQARARCMSSPLSLAEWHSQFA